MRNTSQNKIPTESRFFYQPSKENSLPLKAQQKNYDFQLEERQD